MLQNCSIYGVITVQKINSNYLKNIDVVGMFHPIDQNESLKPIR